MPLDVEKLKALSPRQKIKKLKEMEELRKKEIQEAEALRKTIEKQVENEKIPEDVKIPETKQVDIAELFISGAENLEGQAQTAPTAHLTEESGAVMYNTGEGMMDKVDYKLNITNEDFVKMEDKLDIRRYSNISEATAKMATASLHILDHAKKYSRG